MATVHLAEAPGPAGVTKRLAIKRMRPSLAVSPRFLEMFVAEARVAVGLSHARIVPVLDFGRVGGEYFLALEHVEGRDFGAVLARARARNRPLGAPLGLLIAARVLEALDYAHRRGIVHRDVTPGNVLVSVEGEVRLGDFGVALGPAAEAAGARGTPAYMAPEQARGETVDPRVDIFAVGLLLHEAVTGVRVYGSEGGVSVIERARHGDVPPLPEDAPAAVRRLVARATARDPDARHAGAAAMLEETLAALAVSPTTERDLARALADLFDGQAAAPVEPLADVDLAGVDAAADEVTYLGGGLHALETTPNSDGAAPGDAPPTRLFSRRRAAALAGALALAFALAAALSPQWLGGEAPARTGHPAAATSAAPQARAPKSPPRTVAPTFPTEDGTRPSATTGGKPPVKASTGTGTLDLGAVPWARVRIDGRDAGETPLLGVRLSAGRHVVRLENPHLRVVREILVDVRAGAKTTEVVRFE